MTTTDPRRSTMTAPLVHIVDDDDLACRATVRLLAAVGLEARSYGSAEEFLDALQDDTAGCLILDVRLPRQNGLDLQAALTARRSLLPIVFLTGHGEIPDTVRAMQGGAVDFLTKPVDGDVLVTAVRKALARDAQARDARSRQDSLRTRYDRLTLRERQVFRHLIGGQLNKQVAADLDITERTIKMHRARIFEKLEVGSMAEMARLAVAIGIDPSDPAA